MTFDQYVIDRRIAIIVWAGLEDDPLGDPLGVAMEQALRSR